MCPCYLRGHNPHLLYAQPCQLCAAAYATGCFHDIHTVAFASDAIPDLIPVDTTAALTITAAASACAHGPYGEGRARVYHSASAESYPNHAPAFFDKLHRFWTLNPPPFSLPFTRCVSVSLEPRTRLSRGVKGFVCPTQFFNNNAACV
jgi:hypothetical protein